MNFICLKDSSHKFQLEPPADKKGTAWAWKGIVHCPYCGTDNLQENFVPAVLNTGVDLVKARSENRESTKMALEMAGKARQELNARDPEVTLAPIQGASAFAKNSPIKVRRSIMQGLESRVDVGRVEQVMEGQ